MKLQQPGSKYKLSNSQTPNNRGYNWLSRAPHQDIEYFEEDADNDEQEQELIADEMINEEEIEILFKRGQDILEASNYDEGLSIIEETLQLRNRFYSADSPEYRAAFSNAIIYLNDQALKLFNNDLIDSAYKILKKCQQLTSPKNFYFDPKMRILTFNNLACCLRRMNKSNSALRCLQICLKILAQTNVKDYSGMTNLNICALYMQFRKHDLSIKHANQAILDFSLELINLAPKSNVPQEASNSYYEKIKMLAISYYNLGCEEEAIQHYDKTLDCYEKACKLLDDHFGPEHEMSLKFRGHLLVAQHKYINNQMKKTKRPSSAAPNTNSPLNKIYKKQPPKYNPSNSMTTLFANHNTLAPSFRHYFEGGKLKTKTIFRPSSASKDVIPKIGRPETSYSKIKPRTDNNNLTIGKKFFQGEKMQTIKFNDIPLKEEAFKQEYDEVSKLEQDGLLSWDEDDNANKKLRGEDGSKNSRLKFLLSLKSVPKSQTDEEQSEKSASRRATPRPKDFQKKEKKVMIAPRTFKYEPEEKNNQKSNQIENISLRSSKIEESYLNKKCDMQTQTEEEHKKVARPKSKQELSPTSSSKSSKKSHKTEEPQIQDLPFPSVDIWLHDDKTDIEDNEILKCIPLIAKTKAAEHPTKIVETPLPSLKVVKLIYGKKVDKVKKKNTQKNLLITKTIEEISGQQLEVSSFYANDKNRLKIYTRKENKKKGKVVKIGKITSENINSKAQELINNYLVIDDKKLLVRLERPSSKHFLNEIDQYPTSSESSRSSSLSSKSSKKSITNELKANPACHENQHASQNEEASTKNVFEHQNKKINPIEIPLKQTNKLIESKAVKKRKKYQNKLKKRNFLKKFKQNFENHKIKLKAFFEPDKNHLQIYSRKLPATKKPAVIRIGNITNDTIMDKAETLITKYLFFEEDVLKIKINQPSLNNYLDDIQSYSSSRSSSASSSAKSSSSRSSSSSSSAKSFHPPTKNPQTSPKHEEVPKTLSNPETWSKKIQIFQAEYRIIHASNELLANDSKGICIEKLLNYTDNEERNKMELVYSMSHNGLKLITLDQFSKYKTVGNFEIISKFNFSTTKHIEVHIQYLDNNVFLSMFDKENKLPLQYLLLEDIFTWSDCMNLNLPTEKKSLLRFESKYLPGLKFNQLLGYFTFQPYLPKQENVKGDLKDDLNEIKGIIENDHEKAEASAKFIQQKFRYKQGIAKKALLKAEEEITANDHDHKQKIGNPNGLKLDLSRKSSKKSTEKVNFNHDEKVTHKKEPENQNYAQKSPTNLSSKLTNIQTKPNFDLKKNEESVKLNNEKPLLNFASQQRDHNSDQDPSKKLSSKNAKKSLSKSSSSSKSSKNSLIDIHSNNDDSKLSFDIDKSKDSSKKSKKKVDRLNTSNKRSLSKSSSSSKSSKKSLTDHHGNNLNSKLSSEVDKSKDSNKKAKKNENKLNTSDKKSRSKSPPSSKSLKKSLIDFHSDNDNSKLSFDVDKSKDSNQKSKKKTNKLNISNKKSLSKSSSSSKSLKKSLIDLHSDNDNSKLSFDIDKNKEPTKKSKKKDKLKLDNKNNSQSSKSFFNELNDEENSDNHNNKDKNNHLQDSLLEDFQRQFKCATILKIMRKQHQMKLTYCKKKKK